MKADLISMIEVSIDSLGTPDYDIFITYFEPAIDLDHHVERTAENEARALELWNELGRKVLESMR